MRTVLVPLLHSLAAAVLSRAALQLEILALRQQLAVLNHTRPRRAHLRPVDRLFWLCLSKLWSGWRNPLVIVKPDTVVAWSRKGFRLFWTWKCRSGRIGRPAVAKAVRDLIRKISQANQLWGAPRVHGELLKLGISAVGTALAGSPPHRPGRGVFPHQMWCATFYWGKPAVRDRREASGNVAHGGNVNPARNRKGEHGNPPPKGRRARDLSRPLICGRELHR